MIMVNRAVKFQLINQQRAAKRLTHRAANPANSHRVEKLGKAFSQWDLTVRASYALNTYGSKESFTTERVSTDEAEKRHG